jgi:hypothetical protein
MQPLSSKYPGKKLPRHEFREAIDRLTVRLGLFPFWSEDWAMEAADGGRVPEFCAFYASANLSPTDKIVLMHLIVASLDDYLLQTPPGQQDSGVSAAVENLLRQDFPLHAETVKKWARQEVPESVNPEHPASTADHWEALLRDDLDDENERGWVFYVTPMMRRIWADCAEAPSPFKSSS